MEKHVTLDQLCRYWKAIQNREESSGFFHWINKEIANGNILKENF